LPGQPPKSTVARPVDVPIGRLQPAYRYIDRPVVGWMAGGAGGSRGQAAGALLGCTPFMSIL
jgi:hypothetical protein